VVNKEKNKSSNFEEKRKHVENIPILIHIEKYSIGKGPKSMGDPNSNWDPSGKGDFMIKFHKLQSLLYFVILIHVLSALYQHAQVHNDTLTNI